MIKFCLSSQGYKQAEALSDIYWNHWKDPLYTMFKAQIFFNLTEFVPSLSLYVQLDADAKPCKFLMRISALVCMAHLLLSLSDQRWYHIANVSGKSQRHGVHCLRRYITCHKHDGAVENENNEKVRLLRSRHQYVTHGFLSLAIKKGKKKLVRSIDHFVDTVLIIYTPYGAAIRGDLGRYP